jgi:hypothetical protein
VLDQSLKNNSSISFINTNVLRKGNDYDANVSALVFNVNDKKNIYGWNGKFALSNLYNPHQNTITGYTHNLGFSKNGGKFMFNITQDLADEKFNPNDLGILLKNNYLDHYVWIGYKWLKPHKWYKNIRLNYNFNYSRRYHPDAYQSLSTNINANALLKNLMFVGVFAGYRAAGNDFYEPRMKGRMFRSPSDINFEIWANSNEAKKYYFYIDLTAGSQNLFHNKYYNFIFQNNYRFTNKFSLGHSLNWQPSFNQAGFADINGADIIFSRRNVKTIENTLTSKYNFNKRCGITFKLRHYWSEVNVKEFYTLQNDGALQANFNYHEDQNQNFNAFNIDMVYTWEFAPGSFINIVWKNAIYSGNQLVNDSYFKNFSHTISAPQNNNISLKVIYYLDALSFKKK